MERVYCMARCPHCGASIRLENVEPAEEVNTWCSNCGEFFQFNGQEDAPEEVKPNPVPEKAKRPVLKWVLCCFVATLIGGGLVDIGILPVGGIFCIFAVFSFYAAVINAIINVSRKKRRQNSTDKASQTKAPQAKSTPQYKAAKQTTAGKNAPPQSAPKATDYGKYSETIASEEFRKLEGYLLDAHQILRHAEDMEYENDPFITLHDTGNGGNNDGYLCFETKIFHRPGTMEYNLPASDIEQVKAGMAAHSFTPEGGANPYSTLEKQFIDDVYGAGYVFKGGMPLCYDPDDGQWDANESCYVFRRTLTELGTAYYKSRNARQKLIKAAAYYWKKNNMNRGMLFSQV